MIKTIRPKTNVNIGTKKFGMNTVGNSSMVVFHRATLMIAIRAGRTNSEAVSLRQLSYFSRTINVFPLIEAKILNVVTSRTVGCKPITKILQRNSLRLESFTQNVFGEVVDD